MNLPRKKAAGLFGFSAARCCDLRRDVTRCGQCFLLLSFAAPVLKSMVSWLMLELVKWVNFGILPFGTWADRLVAMLSLQTSSSTSYPFADSSTSGYYALGEGGKEVYMCYTQSVMRSIPKLSLIPVQIVIRL